ncbi:related to CDC24 - GTP/GDP exchange factor for Cdc42p [Pseudozyma flocculosa]|uniref:Related to CDC24 - GTP/GDP exchange factor for Cdc42p n=2 Tax=Pseudozyma flocculosa TaxID=84751 RepID=A0A5C3EX07_9BASI|nr:related to CDC24 - GTP/GDP exchange factor for Cdc42p [Pseudozyma flocculosa]
MPVGPSSTAGSADGGIGASFLGPGGATLMSGAPAAANTIANKQAIAGSSLYQACLNLRDRLYCVPDFGESYLDDLISATSITSNGPPSPATASPKPDDTGSDFRARTMSDPVSQLWQCFRLGAPLCALFNALSPEAALPLNPDANRSNANACKAQVMKFIIALKQNLGWDPDEIFTVTQLYQNDTNGFVKVVRTINRLLDVFEERGLLIENKRATEHDDLETPSDDRAKVVRELLTTERKYVQDLEVLQSYARALAQNDILPPDTLHHLFGNLNKLVDVQRRFLICVEENVRRPADEQHFGHVFKTMEEDFTVYEPFCANYANALELITAEASNLVRLKSLPCAEGCYLDPAYELPAFMIKPVQRICKYPLLLEQLLKKTSKEAPRYGELEEGLQVIRRITDNVNETSRLQENAQLVKELEWRVEDWKGHNIKTFGQLLLSDTFMVAKSDTEREYQVYLFEKILLCCKEVVPNNAKKGGKNASLLKQKGAPALSAKDKRSKTMLQLKGRIFINNVTGAFVNNKMSHVLGTAAGQYALQVWWRGDVDQESFALKCKNDEHLKQWQTAINKLIDEVNLRRQQAAAHYTQTGVSPGSINLAGAGANGRRMTATSSHFPQTPLSEAPPLNPFGNSLSLSRTESQASSYRHDDDGGSDSHSYYESQSGRATPSNGGRLSQPAEQRERQLSLTQESRPRARTEDQDSSLMAHWRSHSPAMPPLLPRGLSYSTGTDHQQLRKASSSRQLRQPGFTGLQPTTSRSSSRAGTVDGGAVEYLDGPSEHVDYRSHGNGPFPARPRGDSVASAMSRTTSDSAAHTRSRSASNPHMYPLPAHLQGPAPPMPKAPPLPNQLADHLKSNHSATALASNGHGNKRFSSSSVSTTDSAHSGQSRPPSSTAASSPINLSGSSSASGVRTSNGSALHGGRPSVSSGPQTPTTPTSSSAVKLLVHCGEDRFVVVVLSTISFASLLDKVTKKVRVCSGRNSLTENGLRIRYIDEDGDQVMMNDDDDLQMAFESARATGAEVQLVIA